MTTYAHFGDPMPVSGFRLVMLTRDGPEHRYVAAAIAAAFPATLKAIVLASPQHGATRWLRSAWRRYSARELASRAMDRTYQRLRGYQVRRARALSAALFSGAPVPPMPNDLLRTVPSHNGEACLALLDSIRPDVVCVYGTAVIRPPVMQRARLAIVNMHTGVAPAYRGADSVFWALHNKEPHQLGVTIHLVDVDVDAGPILATGRVAPCGADNEHTLFAKCVLAGTPLYVQAVRDLLAGTARPEPQALATGRSYRFADRTLGAERHVERVLREGLLAHSTLSR